MANALQKMPACKRQIPRNLSFFILLLDCLAIWLAFSTTSHLSGFMVYLDESLGWSYNFHHFDTRRYYYIFLSSCILFYFVIKGHYSRRIPWLGQVENIFRIIGFAAMFDVFNYYFLDYFSFPFWLTFNWGLCAVYLLVARYIGFLLIGRTKSWPLPIVLVADSNVASDCMHAFSGEKFTGYDVQKVLIYGRKNLDIETLPKQNKNIEIYKNPAAFAQFITDNPNYYYLFGMDQLRGDDAASLIGIIFGVVFFVPRFLCVGVERNPVPDKIRDKIDRWPDRIDQVAFWIVAGVYIVAISDAGLQARGKDQIANPDALRIISRIEPCVDVCNFICRRGNVAECTCRSHNQPTRNKAAEHQRSRAFVKSAIFRNAAQV